MAGGALPIERAIGLAREEAEPAFVARLGVGALVGTPPDAEEGEGWSFHTQVLRGKFSRAAPGIDLQCSTVYPLKKTQSRFAGTLLIGRAKSNDVCIEQTSISKLHARIRIAGDELLLTDAGSKNGCQVNYEALTGEHALTDGDTVTLGHFVFRFHRPAALYRMLRAAMRL